MEEYTTQLQRAFDTGWLTNRGQLVKELEEKISVYLGLEEAVPTLMTNGTIPLQLAVHLLGKGGEIITTPFSYVATTSSIVWEQCTPVFVDIDPHHLTLDETKIEAAITAKTTCILATHVFGNPCNVDAIEAIAKKHHLSVIYDGAHTFGVRYNGKSVFEYGDVTTCSFHATKLFHCGEGGATFCGDEALRKKLYYSHNFGHKSPTSFYDVGINGKMSELQAAMGLTVLPYMETILEARKKIVAHYRALLDWSKLETMTIRAGTAWNYSYFPVIFEREEVLLEVQEALNAKEIVPRRYFYPSLNTLTYVNSKPMEHSERIARQILCLPLYVGLEQEEVEMICGIINENI